MTKSWPILKILTYISSLYIYLGTYHIIIISFFCPLISFPFLIYCGTILRIRFSLFCKTVTLLIVFSNFF